MMKDASGEKRYGWDDADRLLDVKQGPASFTTNWNYSVQYAWNAASQRTVAGRLLVLMQPATPIVRSLAIFQLALLRCACPKDYLDSWLRDENWIIRYASCSLAATLGFDEAG
jgi:hypothetical protein